MFNIAIALFAVLPALYIVWTRIVYPRLVNSTSALLDLADPRVFTARRDRIPGTCIILGGSIAGLLAGAAASHHFERVVIVEAERINVLHEQHSGGEPENKRARIRQYLHGHAFLSFSLLTYRKLFASFDEAVVDVGGRVSHVETDFVTYSQVLNVNKAGNSCPILYMSRDGLEPLLRRLIATRSKFSNIEFRHATVTGLVQRHGSTSLAGVHLRSPEGVEEEVEGSLIVDATGETCAGVKFVGRLAPPVSLIKTTYNPGQSYRTLIIPVSRATQKKVELEGMLAGSGKDDWRTLFTALVAPNFVDGVRYGMLFGILEGDRAMLAVSHDTHDKDPSSLPTTARDIIEAWKSIRGLAPWIIKLGDLLVTACEEEHPEGGYKPKNLDLGPSHWWNYAVASKRPEFPANFIVVGDAIMKLNPAFGSGATKSAVDAVTLDSLLRTIEVNGRSNCFECVPTTGRKFSETFFEKQGPRIEGGWTLIRALDYGEPCHIPSIDDTPFVTNVAFPAVRKLWRTIFLTGVKDEVVAERVMRVINMIDPPFALFEPWVLVRVARWCAGI